MAGSTTFPREVAVMLQGVSTSFTEQNPTVAIAEYGPQGIATADFNEDGLPDIVVGNGFNKYTVSVLITTPQ
jgi:hypothetical protein